MAHNKTLLSGIKNNWKTSAPNNDLSLHVGPMASGASVIADDHSARMIATQHRELIGIEMEAYAVMAAAELSSEPKPTAIIIKSVCDFADPDKNDNWQQYAAFTSAQFADCLLRDIHFEA